MVLGRVGWLAALVIVASPAVAAEIRVRFDQNRGADANREFRFREVPGPSAKDAGVAARLSIAAGEPDANSADLDALTDGAVPATDDDPGACFFFAPGTDGGRLVADLGEVREVRRVSAYSWHRDVRGPQVWTLWASDGAAAGFDPRPEKGVDPAKAGWTRLAAVDTRPAEGRPGGQHGSSVSGADGAPLGTWRWLLFEIARTETRTPFGNTFFGEIDIDDGKEHAPPSAPEAGGGYEISIDVGEMPELKEWVEKKLRPTLETWYPKIVEMLPSEGYSAPRRVRVTFRKEMSGVAYTGGRGIVCAGPWFRANLDGEAAGAVVHELVHVVQRYRGRGNPGWLVEGVADWIRWFRYEPEHLRPRPNPKRAKYTDSYRTTAAFLDWLVRTRDESVIRKLNAAMREGKYTPEIWKEVGGKSVDDLWADYIVTLEAR